MTALPGPIGVVGAYQTKQYGGGVPGGPSVFDALAYAPACTIDASPSSGPLAEAAYDTWAKNLGPVVREARTAGVAALTVTGRVAAVTEGQTSVGADYAAQLTTNNRDFIRDFYDYASMQRNAEDEIVL